MYFYADIPDNVNESLIKELESITEKDCLVELACLPLGPDEDYHQAALIAVASFNHQRDFMYHEKDFPLGVTWAYTFGRHRDSDCLTDSNFECIHDYLFNKYPDDVTIKGAGHWAVGWVESICVRMFSNDGTLTNAGKEALDINAALLDYPVYNEEDFCQREWEEKSELADSDLSDYLHHIDDITFNDGPFTIIKQECTEEFNLDKSETIEDNLNYLKDITSDLPITDNMLEVFSNDDFSFSEVTQLTNEILEVLPDIIYWTRALGHPRWVDFENYQRLMRELHTELVDTLDQWDIAA